MKIARIRTPGNKIVLAKVEGERFDVISDDPSELIAICMDRGRSIAPSTSSFSAEEVELLAPVPKPASLRDFMAFETHVRNCVEGSGGKMNPEWHDQPVFYFSNPAAIVGPNSDVFIPRQSKSMDYELEIACVIGRECRDLDPDDPEWMNNVAGFMLMNDWSARDLAAKEMKQGLGPAKGKDFATSTGPWIVSPDEIIDMETGEMDFPLSAKVNGELKSAGRMGSLHFSWPQILARASADTCLVPGDIIGSGTVGTGCILELRITKGRDENPWLKEGDIVELEAPEFGKLRNTIRERS